jgi:hypothetical protein
VYDRAFPTAIALPDRAAANKASLTLALDKARETAFPEFHARIAIMLAAILVALAAVQDAGTSIILGDITPPQGMAMTAPVRVTLLPSQYALMWDAEAQQRLDMYWELYKPMFAQRKELFFQVSVLAQREALDFVTARMRGNSKIDLSALTTQSTEKGQFEFRKVPPGEYKIVATATLDGQDVVWSEFVQVGSVSPVVVQLKPPAT